MGKIRTTYSLEIKLNAIDMYLNQHMGSKLIAKELGIAYPIIDRWIAHYKKEGLWGLEEKRGTSKGPFKGRPKIQTESEQKNNPFRSGECLFKKALSSEKGDDSGKEKSLESK